MSSRLLEREIRRNARNRIIILAIGFLLSGLGSFQLVYGWVARDSFGTGEAIALAVCTLIALGCLWGLVRALRDRADPASDSDVAPVYQRLGISFEELSERIERELASREGPAWNGVSLLDSFIYRPHSLGVDIVVIDEIAWIYKRETKRRVNHVPVGTTHTAVIHTVAGTRSFTPFELVAASQTVEAFLATVAVRCPGAILGWDAKLAADWRSNNKKVIAAIQQRRQAARAAAAGGRP